MLTDLLKRRNQSRAESVRDLPVPEDVGFRLDFPDPDPDPFPFAETPVAASLPDGVEITDYAKRHAITPEDVWDLIEAGQVICKSRAGKLVVYETVPSRSQVESEHEGIEPEGLPPLPFAGAVAATPPKHVRRQTVEPVTSMTEMALIIDHLSLAKEENKDILRLTQDSITRITQLSDNVIALKDELLKARDEQIENLRQQLTAKSVTIGHLKQEMEDLQMLASSLIPKSPPSKVK